MTTLKLKTIIGSLAVGLMLTAAVHAQMGQMKSMPGSGGMMGMGCPMNMSGTVTMNGQPCRMKADMTPVGKSKGMSSMKMQKPMKMTGTMTCMGQAFHCNMTVTPKKAMTPPAK